MSRYVDGQVILSAFGGQSADGVEAFRSNKISHMHKGGGVAEDERKLRI